MMKGLTFLLLIIFLVSCKQKTQENKISIKNTKINLKLNLYSKIKPDSSQCPFFTIPSNDLIIANSNNLFIVDNNYKDPTNGCRIYKFDSKGKYISSFGGFGNGPGETTNPMLIANSNDTIIVVDYQQFKINKYDFDGKFLFSQNIDNGTFIVSIENISQSLVLANKFRYFISGKSINTIVKLALYTPSSFFRDNENENIIAEYKDTNPLSSIQKGLKPTALISAVDKENRIIYYTIQSPDEYIIYAYDLKTLNTKTIKQNFIKVPDPNSHGFLNIIKQLYVDKNGRLYVSINSINKNIKDSTKFHLDVFDKNKYLGKISLPEMKNIVDCKEDQFIQFIEDKLILRDTDNNTVSIYNYEYY